MSGTGAREIDVTRLRPATMAVGTGHSIEYLRGAGIGTRDRGHEAYGAVLLDALWQLGANGAPGVRWARAWLWTGVGKHESALLLQDWPKLAGGRNVVPRPGTALDRVAGKLPPVLVVRWWYGGRPCRKGAK